jgi:excisionase family DNA binding protein
MATPVDERRMWTLAETAQYLGKKPATLYRWIELGTGPRSYKIGRDRRYRKSDVDRWIETLASTGDGGQPDGR